nr:hypothetical protein [Candidatus Paceibacterota bacterium]
MKHPDNKRNTDQLNFIQRHYILSILLSAGVIALICVPFIINRELRCGLRYDFVNNTVACEGKPTISKVGYAKTQSEISNYLESQKKIGTILEASVYFRDLNNGPVFGVDETAPFIPASLLKLPLSLVFFGMAEKNPEILQEKIMFIGREIDFNQNFVSDRALVPNTQYT